MAYRLRVAIQSSTNGTNALRDSIGGLALTAQNTKSQPANGKADGKYDAEYDMEYVARSCKSLKRKQRAATTLAVFLCGLRILYVVVRERVNVRNLPKWLV